MLGHYGSVALRNLRRAPFAAAVNVLTLALGLACFLVVYAFVTFWQRAEEHFANADRIAVLTQNVDFLDGSLRFVDDTGTPDVAARYLEAEFPAIEQTARVVPIGVPGAPATLAGGDRSVRRNVFAADPEFLEIFDLPFVAGDAPAALRAPRSAVVTQELAVQLFGDAEPLGRSVRIQNAVDAVVTGVTGRIPEPSHMGRSATALLKFDVLVSLDVLDTLRAAQRRPNEPPPAESWLSPANSITYILLPRDGTLTLASLRAGLASFGARHMPAEIAKVAKIGFGALPVRALLAKSIDAELFTFGGSALSVTSVLLTLGMLVLAVACVNYANLASARATRRAHEVGLRKALGARPAQVMLQHLLEAAMFTAIALLLALVLFRLIEPPLARLVGVDVGAIVLASARFWVGLAAVTLATTLVAGAYPAFVLARVPPLSALRGSRGRIGPKALGALLVGAQFAVASFLLIAVTITTLQNRELLRTGLGSSADRLVLIANDRRVSKVASETLRDELARVPQISAVTEMGATPWQVQGVVGVSTTQGMDAVMKSSLNYSVGFRFFEVFDIPLVAGRVFSPERVATDFPEQPPAPGQASAAPRAVVVDRAFVAQLGFASPGAAVDRLVYFPERLMSGFGLPPEPLRIIGVVENKQLALLGPQGVVGTMYQLESELRFHIARVRGDDVAGALDGIDAAWRALSPDVAIDRRFVDDAFNDAYTTFARIGLLFNALAAIAFVICVSGLFGMATLVAGRRTREIGVRKTLGGSAAQMTAMLLRGFSLPVVVANLIAWPAAYVAARSYLDRLIAPIDITPWPFVASLLVTLAIACIAVGGQTLRAAHMKPADVLRHE
ncbi:MAG TPA: ABC transporter permease [Gammaproteobacteria bacterium]|nr:ABC transporter permease [Gammaproteobacteria bacterium]